MRWEAAIDDQKEYGGTELEPVLKWRSQGSSEVRMVAMKGMLGLEQPYPFLMKVMTQIHDDLVPIAWDLGERSISGPTVKNIYPTVKNWFPFIYYKGNNKQKKIWPWSSGQKTRKRSRHWSDNKIWLLNQFLRIWYESRGLHLSVFLRDLTPESIFEKIWYGSRGLHLISAPILCTYLHSQHICMGSYPVPR
jgi:hypothetical protein